MNIQIKDSVGFSVEDCFKIAKSLLENRPPKKNSFDYGFETHGVFGLVTGLSLTFPIQAQQINKRKSEKSPIVIEIKRHYPLF